MKIKELYSSPEKWTQGFYAKTSDGTQCRASSNDAACWCLMGAIQRCYRTDDMATVLAAIRLIDSRVEGNNLIAWNDQPTRTFAEVKALVEELDV